MRSFLILIAIFAFLAVDEINAQKTISSGDKTVSLDLSRDTNLDGLQIEYSIKGSFGGAVSFIPIEPGVWKYKIPTLYEEKPVESWNIVVYSPYYQMQTFDFQSLGGESKNIQLKLVPLGTVVFSGKVLLQNQLSDDGLQIKVRYKPTWKCEHFKLMDCMLGARIIGSTNLEKDGSFTVNLPNFAGDPIIASYKNKGEFEFSLEDKSGKLLFKIKPEDDPGRFGNIQAALNYSGETVFVPVREK